MVPEGNKTRERKAEAAGGIAQQDFLDPNMAARSVNVLVSTISRGFVGGGSSNSSRKRYMRSVNSLTHPPPWSQPSITFSDADFSVCDPNQDDPVVVTATIANWRVHKVLVDQGSLANMLY